MSVVSPVIDTTSGTVPIRIGIKDHEKLKPGLFVSGRIVLEARAEHARRSAQGGALRARAPYVMKLVTDGDQTASSRVFFREGLSGKDDVEVARRRAARSATPTGSCSSATTGSATGTR